MWRFASSSSCAIVALTISASTYRSCAMIIKYRRVREYNPSCTHAQQCQSALDTERHAQRQHAQYGWGASESENVVRMSAMHMRATLRLDQANTAPTCASNGSLSASAARLASSRCCVACSCATLASFERERSTSSM